MLALVATLSTALVACSGKKDETTAKDDNKKETTVRNLTQEENSAFDNAVIGEANEDGVIVVENEGPLLEMLSTKQLVPLIIDFGATWCVPCQQFKPSFDKVAAQYNNRADFFSVDVDKCPKLADKFQVTNVPTIIVIRPDGTMERQLGAMTVDEFDTFVANALK